MIRLAYSVEIDEKSAKACVKDVDVSYKHAALVMRAIKGMKLKEAENYLEGVIAKKRIVPFPKYNTGVGHRSGGKIGKYPVKASKIALKLLKNVENNAENKGLDVDKLVIVHAKADKGATIARRAPKGRWRYNNIVLAHMEVVVREV